MEEKTISEHEGLVIIQQMIQTAKKEQKDDGRGWILWGWMLFSASLLSFVNGYFQWFQTWFFWNLFGGASLLVMLYELISTRFFKKRERVRTYTRELFEKLNTGFFISIMFVIAGINLGLPPLKGFPVLISVYAFWILIYGTALNFRPSIIAAYITWAFGFAGFFAQNFQQLMLIHAGAVLAGYIIPGYLANKEFKKLKAGIK